MVHGGCESGHSARGEPNGIEGFNGYAAIGQCDSAMFEEKLEHGRAMVSQFAFYTFTGVFTTIVFWGTEIFFHYAFESDFMRYVGGVIGLVIGYILKFLLDSRFVFRKAA